MVDAITIRGTKMQNIKPRIREHARGNDGVKGKRHDLETDNNVDDEEMRTRRGRFIALCDYL